MTKNEVNAGSRSPEVMSFRSDPPPQDLKDLKMWPSRSPELGVRPWRRSISDLIFGTAGSSLSVRFLPLWRRTGVLENAPYNRKRTSNLFVSSF